MQKKVHIVPIWVSFVCLYGIHVKTATMKIQYSQVMVIPNSSGYWQIDFQPTDTNELQYIVKVVQGNFFDILSRA